MVVGFLTFGNSMVHAQNWVRDTQKFESVTVWVARTQVELKEWIGTQSSTVGCLYSGSLHFG